MKKDDIIIVKPTQDNDLMAVTPGSPAKPGDTIIVHPTENNDFITNQLSTFRPGQTIFITKLIEGLQRIKSERNAHVAEVGGGHAPYTCLDMEMNHQDKLIWTNMNISKFNVVRYDRWVLMVNKYGEFGENITEAMMNLLKSITSQYANNPGGHDALNEQLGILASAELGWWSFWTYYHHKIEIDVPCACRVYFSFDAIDFIYPGNFLDPILPEEYRWFNRKYTMNGVNEFQGMFHTSGGWSYGQYPDNMGGDSEGHPVCGGKLVIEYFSLIPTSPTLHIAVKLPKTAIKGTSLEEGLCSVIGSIFPYNGDDWVPCKDIL